MRASANFILRKETIEKMGKYGYYENVGTQQVGLVTKGDTMANRKVKVYTYKRVFTSMQVDGYSLDAQNDRMEKYVLVFKLSRFGRNAADVLNSL